MLLRCRLPTGLHYSPSLSSIVSSIQRLFAHQHSILCTSSICPVATFEFFYAYYALAQLSAVVDEERMRTPASFIFSDATTISFSDPLRTRCCRTSLCSSRVAFNPLLNHNTNTLHPWSSSQTLCWDTSALLRVVRYIAVACRCCFLTPASTLRRLRRKHKQLNRPKRPRPSFPPTYGAFSCPALERRRRWILVPLQAI